MSFNPVDRYFKWEDVKELIEHTRNEFIDYMREFEAHSQYGKPADKDLPNYLIIDRMLEKALDFMEFHSKELDCEADAYEEAVM